MTRPMMYFVKENNEEFENWSHTIALYGIQRAVKKHYRGLAARG